MKAPVDPHPARRSLPWMMVGAAAVLLAALGLFAGFAPASAGKLAAAPRCGDGSAPDYGFSYDLQQAHWTVGWQGYASEEAVDEVDNILDRLNEDAIAQTMILILPQDQVGNRVNCAVHFLRYMRLGLPTGERKDNGFVFLIVVDANRIDVHYGVGLGLPALTAPELTNINRAAEETYQSTHSLDQALLALVREFDSVARSNYSPLVSPTATPATINLPPLPAGPLGILTICCLACVGVIILIMLVWVLSQVARGGIPFIPGSGYGGGGFPSRGGRSFPPGRGGGMGFPSGGGRPSPPKRGGGGSGRAGRGN